MRSYWGFEFQDQMGLQWEIKLCDPRNIITDEKAWLRIRQLRDRVFESVRLKPDGEGFDSEPNL